MSSSQIARQFGLAVLALGTLLPIACTKPQGPSHSTVKKDTSVTPETVLAKMRRKYLKVTSYADNAVLVERGVSRARGTVTEVPYSRTALIFDRPNRYSVVFEYGVGGPNQTRYRVACDGTRVRSVASELPEQMHEAIAPRIVTTENFIPEPELRNAILEVFVENLFPQLAMLVVADDEKSIFPRATSMELLAEEKIGDASCYRLALTEPEGTRVLWIDKEKWILRRMELPIDNQRKQMDPTGQFKSVSVDLDFEDIVMNAEFDEVPFAMNVPQAVRLVRRFIPPPSAGPSEELGKPVQDFAFTDINDAKVSPTELSGKVIILEFWQSDCAPCKEHTPLLEAAYQQLKEDQGVAFYGVSTDPKGLATSIVAKTLESWGATFPLLRDLDKHAYYNLNVRATPTLMLLGLDGRLQAFYVGMLENADELVKKVRQVQAGEDLVRAAKEEHAKELEDHEAILEAATIQDSLAQSETTPPDIAPRKLPEHLKLEELWKSKRGELAKPGDVHLVTSRQADRELDPTRGYQGTWRDLQEVLVVDGGNAVIRFDGDGKVVSRIGLPSHAEKDGGFVRSIIDAEKARWYLVSGRCWQQVYVYDKDWKPAFAFPDIPHSGIGDARFIDFKSNGVPSVVAGYWGGLGVQVGNLQGQSLWTNHHLDHVLQVVRHPIVKSSNESLWCTSTRGTVFEISADGKLQREFPVVGHTMVSLGVPTSDGPLQYGISFVKPGQYALVAFDDEGDVVWSYKLPAGEYSPQIPPIQRIDLPGHKNTRAVAGPDGSIHFVSSEGQFIDRFDYGHAIKGLAAESLENGTLLWVSAGDHLTAWRISVKSAP